MINKTNGANLIKTSKVIWECPKCFNTVGIFTEKRPNGNSTCSKCNYTDKTELFVTEKKYIPEKVLLVSGKYYITADGLIVKIIAHIGAGEKTTFIGSNNVEYNYIGHDIRDNVDNDLIAEINEELHFELIRVINEYYNNKVFKHFIDKSFKERIDA